MKTLLEICEKAKAAKASLELLNSEKKNEALEKIAKNLVANSVFLQKENEKDIKLGRENHMSEGLLDRLSLTESRIAGMAEGAMEIVKLDDPIGEILEDRTLPNGLRLVKSRVALGVIGIIYESRPNVTLDAFSLCFKTGNVVILKGGKDAINSNLAIIKIIQDTLESLSIDKHVVQLIEDNRRETTLEFMKMKDYVDVLIPRGSAGLIKAVVENSTIPVIETGSGNCHVYVDESADLSMAVSIIFNAKTQRIGVCNACESLLVHEKIKEKLLPMLYRQLALKNVEVRGDEQVCAILPEAVPATDEDYKTEYLDYILSVKTVQSVEEAVKHINRYNTKHSETIVANDVTAAEYFLNHVDAACVYWNASTRFTDGFEFGLGAEIGISTQKLHARGPMGLKELTSYKYKIYGNGQIRG